MGSVCKLALTEKWSEFINTAIFFREATNVHYPLFSCTLHNSGRSFGSLGTMSFGRNRALTSSLCFLLPSHSDNRASHDLLPIFFLLWLLFLHCNVFQTALACYRTPFRLWQLSTLFLSGHGNRKELRRSQPRAPLAHSYFLADAQRTDGGLPLGSLERFCVVGRLHDNIWELESVTVKVNGLYR